MDVATLVYLLAAAALVVYLYLRRVYETWKRRGLNYLEPQFFFGNTRRVLKREISRGEQFVEIYNQMKFSGWKHGGYFEMIKPMYMPIDLDLVKMIVQKDFWHFPSRGGYANERDDPLTANLFNLEDEKWKTTRAKLTPAFSSGMRLELIEAKVGLAAIISKFKVTLNKKTESPITYAVDSLINSARGGIWLDIQEIK